MLPLSHLEIVFAGTAFQVPVPRVGLGGAKTRRIHCCNEGSATGSQATTDQKGLRVVTMRRRPAKKEHSAVLAPLASRISAILKFRARAADLDDTRYGDSIAVLSIAVLEQSLEHQLARLRRTRQQTTVGVPG